MTLLFFLFKISWCNSLSSEHCIWWNLLCGDFLKPKYLFFENVMTFKAPHWHRVAKNCKCSKYCNEVVDVADFNIYLFIDLLIYVAIYFFSFFFTIAYICSHQACTVARRIHTTWADFIYQYILTFYHLTQLHLTKSLSSGSPWTTWTSWAFRLSRRKGQCCIWLQKTVSMEHLLKWNFITLVFVQGELGLPGPAGVDGEKV